MSFKHNDLNGSNIMVNDARIVGAGFYGWQTASEVHRRITSPQREHFSQARLSDILFSNDLLYVRCIRSCVT